MTLIIVALLHKFVYELKGNNFFVSQDRTTMNVGKLNMIWTSQVPDNSLLANSIKNKHFSKTFEPKKKSLLAQ